MSSQSVPSRPPLPDLYIDEHQAPPHPEDQSAYKRLVKRHWRKVFCYGVVWSWNFLFAAVILFGIMPNVMVDLWRGLWQGFVPGGFFFNALCLVLLPFVSMVLMITVLRGKPVQQLKLFYGIQAPLFLLSMLRLFMVRVLTPGLSFILAVLGIGMLALIAHLRWDANARAADDPMHPKHAASPQDEAFQRWLVWIQFIGLSAQLVAGGYVALLLSFHCIPLFAEWFKSLITFGWLVNFVKALLHPGRFLWVVLFVIPLFGFSATLLVGMPVGLFWIYGGAWRKAYRAHAAQEGIGVSRLIMAALTIGLVWTGIQVNAQPQQQTFALLAQQPKSNKELRSLLGKRDMIRKGLLNAYLGSYRYLSPTSESKVIQREYRKTFGLSEKASQRVQDLYNALAAPMLYQGKHFYTDRDKAETLYTKFFDRPIQKAERGKIIHALTSTYQRRQAEAGVLTIGERKVLLKAQHIKVKEHGDWAAIELHEVYQNQTTQQQEIFYYFSLPEAAVVTGLWLSDRGDSKARFKYVVAPRGAAQRVYKREVRRRIDPALLEQVGPRQYRLRAFPIPPRPNRWQRRRNLQTKREAPHFHLWMTIKVTAHKGRWRLPKLTQKRNVFWNESTKMTLNGRSISRPHKRWLQASLKALKPATRRPHTIALDPYTKLIATPYRAPKTPSLPRGKRMALVLDRSYSMNAHKDKVTALFKWLQTHVLPHNQVDLYLTASPHRGARPLRLNDIRHYKAANTVYFGGHRLGDMLKQFETLRKKTRYDGIFMLTDGHSYDLVKERKKHFAFGAPLWLVHLGGRLAHAYEDATLTTIQKSGGGVTTNLKQQLYKWAATLQLPQHMQKDLLHIEGGYIWHMKHNPAPTKKALDSKEPPKEKTTTRKTLADDETLQASRKDGFSAIAAGQLILGAIRKGKVQKLGVLDAIHQIAKRFSIVSAYSSMIVLVNKRQRDALKKESSGKNRFKRTTENGKAQLGIPSNPMAVTGTPEPHEWLLIILVLIGLLAHVRKQSGQLRFGPLRI